MICEMTRLNNMQDWEIKHSKSLLKDGASLKRPSGNRLLHTCLCCTSEIQTQSEEKEAYCEN